MTKIPNPFDGSSFEGLVKIDEPLAPRTTLGVGGPADYYYEATTTGQIINLISIAASKKIPYVVLGAGSNVLVSDEGFRGLIIKNSSADWEILKQYRFPAFSRHSLAARWSPPPNSGFANMGYDESEYPLVALRADCGIPVQRLAVELLNKGITGLEWFAGIPGTIGGAVYMNMHGGGKFFGDLLVEARLLDSTGQINQRPRSNFEFKYDYSILHKTKEVVLDVVLGLRLGPVKKAQRLMFNWLKHKNASQPKRSSGCVFQNISEDDRRRLKMPTTSTGFIIDRLLRLKGRRHGGAMVSEEHGNFFVNTGSATAQDFYELICEVKNKANKELSVELKEEVCYVGF